MKTLRLSFLISMFLFSAISFAQDNLSNGFLFPDFVEGKVIFNDGKTVSAPLNYCSLNQEMLFKDKSNDNAIMAISEPATVATIIINDRYFVYSGNKSFYEEVKAGETYFYIQWVSIKLSEGKASSYGGYSSTSAVQSYGHLGAVTGSYNGLNLDEKFEVSTDNLYFLKIKNRFRKFNNAKTLAKLFKGHEAEIEAFASEKKIEFQKPSDVASIVEFCGKFSN